MERVTIESLHRWGLLVKTWATGNSYFDGTVPGGVPIGISIEKLPIPRSVDEIRAQAGRVGVGLIIPQNIRGLAVLQYSSDTFVLRLPPKDRLEAMEAILAEGAPNAYDFPEFYKDFMGRPLNTDERFEVHARRVGDYTISMCG